MEQREQVQSKLFWMAVALAAVLIIGREWMAGEVAAPAAVQVRPAAAPAIPVPAPAHVPQAASTAQRAPAAPARIASSAEMTRKFHAAQSLRAFVYEAMRKPEAGGHMYAFIALGTCSHSVPPSRPVGPRTAQQREAIEALARRCDMSKEEMEAARTQLVGSRQLNYEPDPYMPLTFDLLMAVEAPERLRAVAAILETQDPHVLWSLAEAGSANPDVEKGKEIYFLGRHYAGGTGSGVYDYALQLAQCNFGVDCGPGSMAVQLLCIRHGWCAESLQEALRLGLGAEKAAVYAQAVALAGQLSVEIKRKNARAFVQG